MNEEMRSLLDGHESRMERLVNRILHPITERLDRIEEKVDKTNGRVTALERVRIEHDAADRVREQMRKEALDVAAEHTRDALAAKERSRAWWIGIISATSGATLAVATLAGLLAHYLTKI